jgi:hypothetical protein
MRPDHGGGWKDSQSRRAAHLELAERARVLSHFHHVASHITAKTREVPSVRERRAGGCLSNAAAAERKRQSASLLCARSVAYESELSSPEAARFSDS